MRKSKSVSAGILAVTTGVFTAACGDGATEDQVAYCVTESNEVVPMDRCDDDGDGGGGFFYINSGSHGSGHGPGSRLKGGNRVFHRDSIGREQLGLPRSGPIVTGQKGGFGTSVRGTTKSGGKVSGGGSGSSSSSRGGGFGG